MNYWIEVKYVPDFLLRTYEKMKKLSLDFQPETIRVHLDISSSKTLDEVKNDVTFSFESEGSKVLEIRGGID